MRAWQGIVTTVAAVVVCGLTSCQPSPADRQAHRESSARQPRPFRTTIVIPERVDRSLEPTGKPTMYRVQICSDRRFPDSLLEVDKIMIVHRIGRIEIGETSILIAVAAPHRKAALEGCAYIIERVKQILPVWKKEVWDGGEEWIEGA